MRFYLGVHRPHWLAETDVPLFVSHRPLVGRKTYPRAMGPWIQDSGGFTELSLRGGWETSVETYISGTRRHSDEIGGMLFAAPQDWMCEDAILAKTGKTVRDHIRLTVENLIELRLRAPDVPWMPVLQGYVLDDYLHYFELYQREGIDLRSEPLVGVGTMCRRQSTDGAARIMQSLESLDVNLHAFGFKIQGLEKAGAYIASADSMAWSFDARRAMPLPGHAARHKSCQNCLEYALKWRARIVARFERERARQATLW